MKKFHMVSGLPRSGSTLLCNLLNMNSIFHATPTSGVIDILKNIRSTFSHNVTWKAQNRLELLKNMQNGLQGFLKGFYFDKDVVFDKCRGWSNNIALIDEILGNTDSKIIWTYRDPVEVTSSIEAQYQKTLLIENSDELQAPDAFMTLDRRIGTFVNPGGLVSYPVEILKDAIEMGYGDRILLVTYYDIANNTQKTMDRIHDFIGEKYFKYDLSKLKQTTNEYDGFYNYKFLHSIREGKITWKQGDIRLPQKYIDYINELYFGLNKFIFEGDVNALLGIQTPPNNISTTENQEKSKGNPFNL